jgi:LysR substrate binding domain
VAAVAESHPLAAAQDIPLATLADETIELWPASMSPGYHDAVVDACRDAGFEPRLDEQGAGSAVWGTIARGQGAGLVVASTRSQLPRGLILVPLAPPTPSLAIDPRRAERRTAPVVTRRVDVAARVATDRGWLAGSEEG